MNNQRISVYGFISFLVGLAIPVSTSLQNITFVLIALITILDPQIRKSIKDVSRNYFVVFSVLLYILFLLWVFKSQAPTKDITHMLIKMRGYILCPLIFAFFTVIEFRVWACRGFILGALITLIISLAMYLFNHPMFSATSGGWACTIGDWPVFRYHTYHNLFLAVMVIGLISLMLYYGSALSKKTKVIYVLLCLVSTYDILYLVQGRAGQIIYIMMLMLVFLLWNFKKGVIISIGIALLSVAVLQTSPGLKCGLERVTSDVQNYDKGDADTSFGARLEFHKYALEMIKAKLLTGYGTGSFHYAYQKFTGFSGNRATRHPHNDFYWLWVELGVLGPLVLTAIILSGMYYGYKSKTPEGNFAVIISMSYAVCAIQGGAFTDNISGAAFIVLMAIFLSGGTFHRLIKK